MIKLCSSLPLHHLLSLDCDLGEKSRKVRESTDHCPVNGNFESQVGWDRTWHLHTEIAINSFQYLNGALLWWSLFINLGPNWILHRPPHMEKQSVWACQEFDKSQVFWRTAASKPLRRLSPEWAELRAHECFASLDLLTSVAWAPLCTEMKGLQRKLKLRGCSSACGVAFVGERWLQLIRRENKLPLCRPGSLLFSSDCFIDALSAGGCLYCSTVVNVEDS